MSTVHVSVCVSVCDLKLKVQENPVSSPTVTRQVARTTTAAQRCSAAARLSSGESVDLMPLSCTCGAPCMLFSQAQRRTAPPFTIIDIAHWMRLMHISHQARQRLQCTYSWPSESSGCRISSQSRLQFLFCSAFHSDLHISEFYKWSLCNLFLDYSACFTSNFSEQFFYSYFLGESWLSHRIGSQNLTYLSTYLPAPRI